MKNTKGESPDSQDNELDLRDLAVAIWSCKWLVTSIIVGSLVLSTAISLSLPNVYRASALLAPNMQDSSGGLSGLAAQYGGLANLAGINVGSGSADKTVVGIEILKSRQFLTDFISRHELLAPLIAAKRWDASENALVYDESDFDVANGQWIRSVRPPKKVIPSSQEAYERFREILAVSQDAKSGLVTLSVEHVSPTLAKQWADWLVEDLNNSIMTSDVKDAELAIDYLTKKVEETSLSDLHNVFFSLIEEQTKTIMLAKMSGEYLFRTLDPAVVPEEHERPKRVLIVLLGGMAGVLIAIFVAFFVQRPR